MAQKIYQGALLQCSCGVTPASLELLPTDPALGGEPQAATIMDRVPFVNIPSFGLCHSPANPLVLEASAAAGGIQTPMPCMPQTIGLWTPGVPLVMIGPMPALDLNSRLQCRFGGIIQIIMPGFDPRPLP